MKAACLLVGAIVVLSYAEAGTLHREKREANPATGVCGAQETLTYTTSVTRSDFTKCPISTIISRYDDDLRDTCEHWMGSRPDHVASSNVYYCLENQVNGVTVSVTIKATVCCKGVAPANRCLSYNTCPSNDPDTCDYTRGAVVTCASDEKCQTHMTCGTAGANAQLTKSCVKTCSSSNSCKAKTYLTTGESCDDCCTSAFCNREGRLLSCYSNCNCGNKVAANSHCDSSGQCVCNAGCTGARCETCTDTCNPNPCQNGGKCQKSGSGISCCCKPGYGGQNCQTKLTLCDRMTCSNHGECTVDGARTKCVCDTGYYGNSCQKISTSFSCPNARNIYDTSPTPFSTSCSALLSVPLSTTSELNGCKYHMKSEYGLSKVFADGKNGHVTAVTSVGYSYCNNDDCGFAHHKVQTCCPSCFSNPCQNNGYCRQVPFTGQATDYVCRCTFGFTGKYCEKRVQTCLAFGEPHYLTFDGELITFQGICRYILTMYRGDPTRPAFAVYVKNEHRGTDRTVSYPEYVEVQTFGYSVRLGRNNVVMVKQNNGVFNQISLNAIYGNLFSIKTNGRFVRLETNFGLVVQYDGYNMMFVQIADAYQGLLSGICNNMDGNVANDLTDCKGITQAETPAGHTSYGDSCLDPTYTDSTGSCITTPPPQCDVTKYSSNSWCGQIINPSGPFSACVDSKANLIFESCKYDLCRNESARCASLESFVVGCTLAGKSPDPNWRSVTGCPMTCPSNSNYAFSGSACQPTCEEPRAHESCELVDTEVCECNNSLILRDGMCVPVSQCGCKDEHTVRREFGDSWGMVAGTTCTEKKCVMCTASDCKYPGKIIDIAVTPTNGGWSDWTAWSACDTRTNQLTRSRSCDNPSPICGGQACPGNLMETKSCPTSTTPSTPTSTTTTTPSPTPTPPTCSSGFNFAQACSECDLTRNKNMYIANPCTCGSYFQCKIDVFGRYSVTTMPCSPCTCWNQDKLTCDHDPAKRNPDHMNCAVTDVSEVVTHVGRQCITSGSGFARTKESVPGDNTHYIDVDGGRIKMPCAPGTVFDFIACGCVHGNNPTGQKEFLCLNFNDANQPFRTTTNVWVDGSSSNVHLEGAGVIGNALRFDGGNLEIPAYSNKEIRELTIVLWYKRDKTSYTDMQALVANDDCETKTASLRILSRSLTSVGGGIRTKLTNRLDQFLDTVPNDKDWHHVAMTYSFSMKLMTFYVDGMKKGEESADGPIVTNHCPLLIGSMYGSNYFHGLMDEICFYDYAFTASEVTNTYTSQKPSSGMFG